MTPLIDDGDFVLHVGDALETLRGMPAESVHCCVTSPPYWGLRNYDVDGQLGLEPTPEEYVANMVAVFREVRRMLRRDGTCWLNIGDSYVSVGSGIQGADGQMASRTVARVRDRKAVHGDVLRPPSVGGLAVKNLVGIPWRLAFALQADGWYLRSDIIWSKPNPMPESVTDRPTKAHEYLFLLTKSARYFYDADSIREQAEWARWGDQTNGKHEGQGSAAGWIGAKSKDELQGKYANPGNRTTNGPRLTERRHETAGFSQRLVSADGGKNKRTVWEIATEPYPDAHFATFPQALVEPCVLAGCPEGGVVLDPFMGSGTTALVARRHGRRSIGVELNAEYAALAAKRLQQLSLLANA